jgi:hypothetical protein
MKQMMMNRHNSPANMFGILSETPRYEQMAKKKFIPRIYSKKELQLREKHHPSLPYKKVISTLPKHLKWKLPIGTVRTVHSDDSLIGVNGSVEPVTFDDHYDPLPEDFDRWHYMDKMDEMDEMDEIKEPEYDEEYQYECDQEYDEYDKYDKYENDYFD